MFVAVFEARFHVRLEGIIRNPKNEADYARNAQLVISALQSKIHITLHHITGLSVAKGDRKALSNLVRIFLHLVSTQRAPSMSTSASSSEDGVEMQLHGDIAEAARKRRLARKQRYAESKLDMFKTAHAHAQVHGGHAHSVGKDNARPSSAKGKRKNSTAPVLGASQFRYSTGGQDGSVDDLHFADGGRDTSTSFESTNSPSSVSYDDDEEDDWYLSSSMQSDQRHDGSISRPVSTGRQVTKPVSHSSSRPGAVFIGSGAGGRPTSRGAHRGSGLRPQTATQFKKKPTISREPELTSVKDLLAYKSGVMSNTIQTQQLEQQKEQAVHLSQLRQSYLKNSDSQIKSHTGSNSSSKLYRGKVMKITTNTMSSRATPMGFSRPNSIGKGNTTARSGSPPLSQLISNIHASHRSELAARAAAVEEEQRQHQLKLQRLAARPQWDTRSSFSSFSGTVGAAAMPLRKSINTELSRSYDDLIQLTHRLHAMCQQDSKKGVEHIHNLQKLTTKLEAAQRRRDEVRRMQLMKSTERQQKHDDVTQRIRVARMEEHLEREAESFRQKLNSQDFVLLRTAYRDLLKQLYRWKIDEHKEVRERVGAMKDNAKSHIQSLERLFEDRLSELKEQAQSCHQIGTKMSTNHGGGARQRTNSASRVNKSSDTIRTLSSAKKQQNLNQQQREKVILARKEALGRLGDLKHVLVTNKSRGIFPRASASVTSSANTSMESNGHVHGLSRSDLHHRHGHNDSADRYGTSTFGSDVMSGDFPNNKTVRTTNPSADYYYVNIDNVVIPTTSTLANDIDEISLHPSDGSTDLSSTGMGVDLDYESSDGIPSFSMDDVLNEATEQMELNQKNQYGRAQNNQFASDDISFGSHSQDHSQSPPQSGEESFDSIASSSLISDPDEHAYEYDTNGLPVPTGSSMEIDSGAVNELYPLSHPQYDSQYDDTYITGRYEKADEDVLNDHISDESSASTGSASTTDRRRM